MYILSSHPLISCHFLSLPECWKPESKGAWGDAVHRVQPPDAKNRTEKGRQWIEEAGADGEKQHSTSMHKLGATTLVDFVNEGSSSLLQGPCRISLSIQECDKCFALCWQL